MLSRKIAKTILWLGRNKFCFNDNYSPLLFTVILLLLLCLRPIAGALSDDARLTSDVCLSVAYIGPKSRTERHRKTKIGTEVAHVTL